VQHKARSIKLSVEGVDILAAHLHDKLEVLHVLHLWHSRVAGPC
jgi:hypothetical protein